MMSSVVFALAVSTQQTVQRFSASDGNVIVEIIQSGGPAVGGGLTSQGTSWATCKVTNRTNVSLSLWTEVYYQQYGPGETMKDGGVASWLAVPAESTTYHTLYSQPRFTRLKVEYQPLSSLSQEYAVPEPKNFEDEEYIQKIAHLKKNGLRWSGSLLERAAVSYGDPFYGLSYTGAVPDEFRKANRDALRGYLSKPIDEREVAGYRNWVKDTMAKDSRWNLSETHITARYRDNTTGEDRSEVFEIKVRKV